MAWGSYGRVQTSTDLNGYVKTYAYDAIDRVTQITYPDGTTDQNSYTNLDLTLHKDRQNRWTRYSYNALEQLVGVEDPQGRVTTYERCLCGALIGLVDPLGHRTKWSNDLENRPISKTFADGSAYAYTYETSTSRLKTVTDPKGQVTTYTYNDDDTPHQVAFADSTVALSYDTPYPRLLGLTKTITATSASYATAFTYNAVASGTAITGGGRVATETGPLGSTSAISYTYDQLGRVTGTAINGVSSTVTYDSLGRVTGAGNPLGNFTYGYAGITPRLQSVSNDQNGLNTSYAYQTGSGQDYRLTDITNNLTGTTVLSKFDYTYNPVGAIATEQEQTDSSTPTLWTYGYDNADQLNSAVRTNTSTNAVISQYVYGYDAAGNRTSQQVGLNVTKTTVNNLNQNTSAAAGGPLQFSGTLSKPSQVTVGGNTATYANSYTTNFAGNVNVTTGTNTVAVIAHDVNGNTATNNYQVVVPSGTGVSPTYDGDGNLTNSGNGQAYTWDAENELLSITYSSGANSGNHTEFTYDALGRRLSIVERTGTTLGSGAITSTKQFVWVKTNLTEERNASNSVTKRFYPQGEQISGTSYYYTRDHLGSVREMTDSSGTIQARYDYDAYGLVSKVSGSMDSDFQYAGYYEHAPSGLNLTLFRAYDPNTAKWLSRDPMGEGSGPNLYQYVYNNPSDHVDSLGLRQEDPGPPWAYPPPPDDSGNASSEDYLDDFLESFSLYYPYNNPGTTTLEYGVGYPIKIAAVNAAKASSCSLVRALGLGAGRMLPPLYIGLTIGATLHDASQAPQIPPYQPTASAPAVPSTPGDYPIPGG